MQGQAGMMRLIPVCTFLFMGLMYREVKIVFMIGHAQCS
jgi:hypothetical protein